jgi:hypothetical protein
VPYTSLARGNLLSVVAGQAPRLAPTLRWGQLERQATVRRSRRMWMCNRLHSLMMNAFRAVVRVLRMGSTSVRA